VTLDIALRDLHAALDSGRHMPLLRAGMAGDFWELLLAMAFLLLGGLFPGL
jgi:hypothetical protein